MTRKILIAAALALCATAALPATAPAASPWWQVLTGSRPSHLPLAPDQAETQKLTTAKSGGILAAKVEVGGEEVGCLGSGELFGLSAAFFCGEAPIETAPQLEAALEAEAAYGPDPVQVTGGPVGEAPFLITTPGRWVPPIELTPLFFETIKLGTATAEVTSEGSGTLAITITNLGDAPADGSAEPVTVTSRLPEGLAAYGVFDPVAGAQGSAGPVECTLPDIAHLTCVFEGELPSYEAIEIDVFVARLGPPGEAGEVSVSGGGAPPTPPAAQTVNASEAPVPFGLEAFQALPEEEGGKPTTAAGRRPFQLTTTLQFASGALRGTKTPLPPSRREADIEQPALPRNTRVTLPAGFAGSALATETCPMAVFLLRDERFLNGCPDSSAIGVASVTVIESKSFGFLRLAVPVFNLPPAHGSPARFGFMPAGTPVVADFTVDPENEYEITGEVRNAPQIAKVISATLSVWGVPGDPRHDTSRGWGCVYYTAAASECPAETEAGAPPQDQTPLLRMPVSCAAEPVFAAAVEPWNTPLGAAVSGASSALAAPRACESVPFAPTISAALTSKAAESPSGLDFELDLPAQWPSGPSNLAEAEPRRVQVTLPEGVTANPSQAEGLATCSPGQLAAERYDSVPGQGCPDASKLGSITGSTPLIEEPLRGALYLATPYENPFDSLLALYIVARVPERGILVKQAGKVEPDPRSGQLISTFDELPQLPYDNFSLHFRAGARGVLVAPGSCGSHATTAHLVPHSARDPEHPAPGEVVEQSSETEIERGVNGGPCPTDPAPFDPGFQAGALNNDAGAYSPFLMRLTRNDGDQDLTRFSARLPKGAAARLAGVEQCPEAAIAAARSNSGLAERARPSCPAGSEIGTVTAGAGVGSVLTYVRGGLYLAGPHQGAPLSVLAIVPAVAGPFDVGTVVTREALRIDPRSAVVEADGSASDPIPHILAGIPLKVRDVRVDVERPGFTFNPTSCAEDETRARIFSGGADVFSSADDVPHSLGARFQAAGCRALGFKPRISLRLRGGTKRGAFPALRMVYRPRGGKRDANLERFALRFPTSAFIEQGHFRTICTRKQFAAGEGFGANCPKASIYGRVKVHTPILDQPLTGPVFLRSSDNNLPDVVLALHGPPSLPVKLEAPARIDSVKGGLRAIAWAIPDAPVSRVVLNMQGGQKGLFVNSRDLCRGSNRATLRLAAHNGRRRTLRPPVRAVRCAKAKRRARAAHRRAVG